MTEPKPGAEDARPPADPTADSWPSAPAGEPDAVDGSRPLDPPPTPAQPAVSTGHIDAPPWPPVDSSPAAAAADPVTGTPGAAQSGDPPGPQAAGAGATDGPPGGATGASPWAAPEPPTERAGPADAPGGPPAYESPAGSSGPPGYEPAGDGAVGYAAPVPWRAGPDDTTWALLAHLSFFAFGVIAPLAIMLTRGKRSKFVRDQAVEALNLHISIGILAVVCLALFFLIIPLIVLAVALLAGAVLAVVGSIAASRGEAYRYPWNIRLVR